MHFVSTCQQKLLTFLIFSFYGKTKRWKRIQYYHKRGDKIEKFLEQIDPYTFSGSAFLLGLFLANEFTEEEQNSIGNWLQLTGLTIQTYASQVSTFQSANKKTKKVDLNIIQATLKKMEEKIEQLQSKNNFWQVLLFLI